MIDKLRKQIKNLSDRKWELYCKMREEDEFLFNMYLNRDNHSSKKVSEFLTDMFLVEHGEVFSEELEELEPLDERLLELQEKLIKVMPQP